MNILVGNTGFVGKNLKEKITFDYEFNSSNIEKLKECKPYSNIYLSCLPATKWKVNQNLYQDIKNINKLIEFLKDNKYNNVYLISTIDVYSDSPLEVDEDYKPNFSSINYGSNRLFFEYYLKEVIDFKNFKIFRLPALYGKYLKKNVIFDLINNNQLEKINLNSYYQWYDLNDLANHIKQFSSFDGEVFNLFTEPIHTYELVNTFFPDKKIGYFGNTIKYNFKTKYSENKYLYDHEESLNKIRSFLNEIRNH
tara:strand:+ start:4624 stop:5379 length:756 start_codon:yes stop_codon:yes gene_type:complete